MGDIVTGRKSYELRIYDVKRQKIRMGDIIIFTCGEDSVRTCVDSISIFN